MFSVVPIKSMKKIKSNPTMGDEVAVKEVVERFKFYLTNKSAISAKMAGSPCLIIIDLLDVKLP